MMRRIRKLLAVFASILLMMPALLVSADTAGSKSGAEISQETGELSSKDEVVYAKLSPAGENQEVYVVNILNIEEPGEVTDYGPYTNLKNLTDMSPIEKSDAAVNVTAEEEGKFYYQGDLNKAALPWNVSISYTLDGQETAPEELAGKSGHVQIEIQTSRNESAEASFFENYLLQISFPLNGEKFTNIQAPDGMIVNAGKNKQATFTVMPEKEGKLTLEADVADFELEGIDITAIPSSLPIDAPDIDDMTGEMDTLTKAIKEVNDGVGQLQNGASELQNGAAKLSKGSREYQDGIVALNGSSSKLVSGSKSIEQALQKLNQSLSGGAGDMGLGDLKKMQDGLSQSAAGLREVSKNLAELQLAFSASYNSLNEAMDGIPNSEISEAQIEQLKQSGADPNVVAQLLETYAAAKNAKGVFAAGQGSFAAVSGTLQQVSGSLTGMAKNLDSMAAGLSQALNSSDAADATAQLQAGVNALAANYESFHSGLEEYTGGLSRLAGSYSELHNGIAGIADGTGELSDGAAALHGGTAELYEATRDLPEQMKEEVEGMLEEYDKSDFKPVSFVSPKNEKVNSVQFVLKTESIKQEETKEVEKLKEEPQGFWARLKALFS
ncbi:YhgE/Pip domain-containing protein [Bacillus infantis]|uniref:YhgE/Pip domain-containing protein n=1 Tax=Bacillus infantis TaxID=324767 RepID=UPI003CE8C018